MRRALRGSGENTLRVSDFKKLRSIKNENQTKFWQRFGVTQSRGSRFEKGEELPISVAILIELYLQKKVSDTDLINALQSISPADSKKFDYV